MRHTQVAVALMVAGIGTTLHASEFTDVADVIAANPIYETVNEPRRECRTEYITENVAVPRPERRSYAGSIIGGVAGGLLGSQIGEGNGRIASSAAGAVIGALVGDRIDNRDPYYAETTTRSRPVERCYTTDNYRRVLKGYDVAYRYNGRVGNVILPYDPGRTVRIGVGVVDDRSPEKRIVPIEYERRDYERRDRDEWSPPGHSKHRDEWRHRYESPYKYKHTKYIPPGG